MIKKGGTLKKLTRRERKAQHKVQTIKPVLRNVMNANMSKLSVGQDAEGKQQKPTDFVPPEAQLQLILDELKD